MGITSRLIIFVFGFGTEHDTFLPNLVNYTTHSVSCLMQLDIPSRVKVPVEKLKKFILVVRSCMFDNPYHNWFHAIDVTQV